MTIYELARQPATVLARDLHDAQADREELSQRLHCYRAAADMLADALDLGVSREEVAAQLRALGLHIKWTVAGVTAATSPLALAGEGFEPEAGAEGSRSAPLNVDAATAPALDERPRPQRILEALEAVTS